MAPKTEAPSLENGVVTNRFNLSLSSLQLNIVHQFCTQGQFPTADLKRAAAEMQEQIEALVPQEV